MTSGARARGEKGRLGESERLRAAIVASFVACLGGLNLWQSSNSSSKAGSASLESGDSSRKF